MTSRWLVALALGVVACGATPVVDTPDAGFVPVTWPPDDFATSVVSFTPGPYAGFGEDKLPGVVLGPPYGGGAEAGSLDVVSLGDEGSIVLGFSQDLVDGPGADVIVFENAFDDYVETGIVGASLDGVTFVEWPCDATDPDGRYIGCAGVHPVFANARTNDIDPTDPSVAGGDAFDLAALGLSRAKFIRVRDSGHNPYAGTTGGFDLDAVSIVHGAASTP